MPGRGVFIGAPCQRNLLRFCGDPVRYANAFPTAVSLIADGKINAGEMITQTFPFEKTAEAFRFAYENPRQVMKVVVTNP